MTFKQGRALISATVLLFALSGLGDRPKAFEGGEGLSGALPSDDSLSAVSTDTLRKIRNIAFAPGEYLRFDVKYSFVVAGEARLKVSDITFRGRKCYKVDFTLDSKPFFDAFYKVRDRYLTIIDSAGIFPWKFEQHIREGGYTRDFEAEFDQVTHRAMTTEGKTCVIPPYVQDMMSAFYFARTVDYSKFKSGERLHLQNFYKDSTYDLDVKFRGRQTIEVDAGKFNCVVIEPLVKEGGLFKSEGKIYLWLTDDDRKLPVLITSKIKIGSVDSELVEYVGVAGPVDAKIPRD